MLHKPDTPIVRIGYTQQPSRLVGDAVYLVLDIGDSVVTLHIGAKGVRDLAEFVEALPGYDRGAIADELDNETETGRRDKWYGDKIRDLIKRKRIKKAKLTGDKTGFNSGDNIVIDVGTLSGGSGGGDKGGERHCNLVDTLVHELTHMTRGLKDKPDHEGMTILIAIREVCRRYPMCCGKANPYGWDILLDALASANTDVAPAALEAWLALYFGEAAEGPLRSHTDRWLILWPPVVPRGCGGVPIEPPDPEEFMPWQGLSAPGGGGKRVSRLMGAATGQSSPIRLEMLNLELPRVAGGFEPVLSPKKL